MGHIRSGRRASAPALPGGRIHPAFPKRSGTAGAVVRSVTDP